METNSKIDFPNILIVDDWRENIEALTAVLEDLNCNILGASSGKKALNILETTELALILLDVQMPDMDGFETAKLIKKKSSINKYPVPIIFITAINFEDRFVSKGYASGAVDYLSKPINSIILRSKVNVFIELYNKKKELHETNVQLENEIQKHKDTLEMLIHSEKLAALGQMAAGISHEFNNILAVIDLISQSILLENKKNNNLDTAVVQDINDIRHEINRAKDITNNMLTFAKPKTEENKNYYDITEIIKNVITTQRKSLSLHHIKLVKKFKTRQKLYINKNRLEQVFLNLFLNSIHAIMPKKKGTIKISTKIKNNNYIVKFTDNGIGLDDSIKNKIFNPFFSTKGAYSKDSLNIEGTGLGLSVTHSIIKNHNGTIEVESKKNEKTTFIITLPLQLNIESDANKINNIENKIKENFNDTKIYNFNVMIIDDEIGITSNLTKIIKSFNNGTVKAFNSANEGLKELKNNPYDIVLLDKLMPDCDGEDVLKSIKNINRIIQVVFITGVLSIDKIKLTEQGVADFITKPFNFNEIKQIFAKSDLLMHE